MEEINRKRADALAKFKGVLTAVDKHNDDIDTEYLKDRFNDCLDRSEVKSDTLYFK